MAKESGQAYLETISIIIPVYNVEPYLDRCITSVLQQSYPKLEVLLVDDGSTDNSGLLCDVWAEKDSRIRVIHKENGGVSDARNVGLDAATGDYISFVDSDDYTAPDMIEKLYNAIQANNAELSICSFLFVNEAGVPLIEHENLGLPINDQVVSGLDILKAIHTAERGIFYVFSWNKLYCKHLFDDIRFPKGKLSEDTFVSYKVLSKCSRVACISNIGYYYVQRAGSYTHNRDCLSILHEAEARFEHMQFFYDRRLFNYAGHAYCNAGLKLQDALARRKEMPELSMDLDKTFQVFRRNLPLYKFCTPKEKMQILFIYCCPQLFHFIFRNPLRNQAKRMIRDGIAKYRLRNHSWL